MVVPPVVVPVRLPALGIAATEAGYRTLYTTARVQLAAVETVKRAIEAFVDYVRANEPGTRMYAAWQRQDDPTRFVHLFIFEDAAAQTAHSESAAVARFEEIYRPELVGGDVVFTDFDLVAANGR